MGLQRVHNISLMVKTGCDLHVVLRYSILKYRPQFGDLNLTNRQVLGVKRFDRGRGKMFLL